MKNILTTITKKTSMITGKAGLVIQKKNPEILLGFGVLGFVGTVILASKATLEADKVLAHHRKKLSDMKDAYDIAQKDEEFSYDDELYKRDLILQNVHTGVDLVKLYGPAIALGTISLACILTSRNILQKRYLGVVSAYNAVSLAFDEYRQRVREEAGELMDRHYRYGTELDTITSEVVGEDGKKKKVKEIVEKIGSGIPSDVAVFFDRSNPNWDRNPNLSLMFLRAQQNMANDILHTRGHIFLNEVYDMLGFDHTQGGAVLGWVMGEGDDFVDFGLYDPENENNRRFINGTYDSILLDFNHDGVIWDKI